MAPVFPALQNPWISPNATGNFTYTCLIDDEYNTAQGFVSLNVRPVPYVNFGSGDTLVCVYDTLVLDAGNPGAQYVWSNGSAERTISVTTTGIGFDMQTYSVTVTNPTTGCQSGDTVSIVFDFSACNAIDEDNSGNSCLIYPNPGDGTLHLVFQRGVREAIVSASNLLGENIWGPFEFKNLDVDGEVVINLGKMPEGVYFIHIKNDNSVLSTSKYILRR